ncbi:MAG: conjugal transfer protein TraX [Lachnospiraceae bacterium]|nr:conjugal transfer protein TraX [Lachnospiraceae bacterium]
MSIFILKIIAMVTMLCDHVASTFFKGNVNAVMRSIGRTAFPIYAFLIAEGFYHIKDKPEKLSKHFTRLFILTLVSEIPYDLMETGKLVFWPSQSVMLTLLVGMAGLMIADRFKDSPLFVVFFYAIGAVATYFTAPNYKLTGIFMILFYYFFTVKCRDYSVLKRYLVLLAFSIIYLPLYNWARFGFPNIHDLFVRSLNGWHWLIPYIWINLFLAVYNGKNGYKNRMLNICYAWFYPVHMLIIGIIALLL